MQGGDALHWWQLNFAYMAPQPHFPLTSVGAIALGGALLFGRTIWKFAGRVCSWRQFRALTVSALGKLHSWFDVGETESVGPSWSTADRRISADCDPASHEILNTS
jgi:hypothetical protein